LGSLDGAPHEHGLGSGVRVRTSSRVRTTRSIMNAIQLYNDLEKCLRRGDLAASLLAARALLAKLSGMGACYGWNKFRLTGIEELDVELLKLDPFLTGDRA